MGELGGTWYAGGDTGGEKVGALSGWSSKVAGLNGLGRLYCDLARLRVSVICINGSAGLRSTSGLCGGVTGVGES